MYSCFLAYRERVNDQETQTWLDDWKERTSRNLEWSVIAEDLNSDQSSVLDRFRANGLDVRIAPH